MLTAIVQVFGCYHINHLMKNGSEDESQFTCASLELCDMYNGRENSYNTRRRYYPNTGTIEHKYPPFYLFFVFY